MLAQLLRMGHHNRIHVVASVGRHSGQHVGGVAEAVQRLAAAAGGGGQCEAGRMLGGWRASGAVYSMWAA